ncbi:MAG TPA: SIR2 family protein [Thermoanaerobaculia bacterium]|nr:SIR2 family protein [Thermoanaerobaculia bacterium]
MACGYLGWAPFLDELKAALGPDEAARLSTAHPTFVVDAIQDLLDGERFTQIFQHAFHPDRATKDPPRWLELLFELDLGLYITTNYTHEIETVSKRYGFEEALLWYAKGTTDLVRRLGRKRVLYLHGRFDDDPLYRPDKVRVVLGDRSYQYAYHKVPTVREILRTVVRSSTLLIVGASLDDEDIRYTLRAVAADAQDPGAPHFVIHEVWPVGHPRYADPALRESDLVDRYHLQPIFHRVEIGADGKPVFDDLQRVIQELVDAVRHQRANEQAPGGRSRDGAHDASLAANLTRLLPSPGDFADVARQVGIDLTHNMLQRTPQDRWSGLVSTCRRMDAVETLRAAARERLPPRRHRELRSTWVADRLELTNRARVTTLLDTLATPFFGPLRSAAEGRSSDRDDLGLLALDRYWGIAPPDNAQVEEWRSALNASATVYQRAREKEQLTADGRVNDGDLGVALAADLLARRCTAAPNAGQALLADALPHLAEYGAYRHEILIHLLAWWPTAKESVLGFIQGDFSRPGRGSVDQLLALTFAERLLREAGVPPIADQIPTPIAVQWARRSGLDAYVASVLEILGENRVEVYLDEWRAAKGAARTALARAVRRSAWQGPPVADPVLAPAIEATRPETAVARILELVAKPPVRAVWLDILPVDPDQPQIQALGELLAGGAGWRAERTARRSAELLSEHPDLVMVWDALGSRRRHWIERLQPESLPQLAMAELGEILQRRTLALEELADFARLGARLRNRAPALPDTLEGEA